MWSVWMHHGLGLVYIQEINDLDIMLTEAWYVGISTGAKSEKHFEMAHSDLLECKMV